MLMSWVITIVSGLVCIRLFYDDLPAANLRCTVYRHEVAVENTRVLHTHAVNPQQVVRLWMEQLWKEVKKEYANVAVAPHKGYHL